MKENFHVSEVIKVLIEQERVGYTFYQEAAAAYDDGKAKKLFERLAKDEMKHEATFIKLLEKSEKKEPLSIEMADAIYIRALIAAFAGVDDTQVKKSQTARSKDDALKVAETMERDAIFFLNEVISFDPALDEDKTLLLALKEERRHLADIMQHRADGISGSLML